MSQKLELNYWAADTDISALYNIAGEHMSLFCV